jgi:hypothetical protein
LVQDGPAAEKFGPECCGAEGHSSGVADGRRLVGHGQEDILFGIAGAPFGRTLEGHVEECRAVTRLMLLILLL